MRRWHHVTALILCRQTFCRKNLIDQKKFHADIRRPGFQGQEKQLTVFGHPQVGATTQKSQSQGDIRMKDETICERLKSEWRRLNPTLAAENASIGQTFAAA